MIQLTNSDNQSTNVAPFMVGETKVEVKSPRQISFSARPIFSVETCASIELSLVPEVEHIFIERESDGEFRIITVVDKRDAGVREKLYAREECLMEAYPGIKFDFHIVARMGRDLDDVMTNAGKVAFEKR